ncbi:MAG: MBL fold metallo-hydrolase [Elusimicrobiota bacterium]|jgi:phosphoribosyl 1,2-cyclic phosphodiesterase|nr:MBL fold metallo-hydrolase [Elusimicrobiota bacterium]
MLSFCILSSGSSGNVSVLQTDFACILIDCGCPAKYIIENLADLKIKPTDLTAALITHAHSDHINASALNFLIKNKIPLYLHSSVLDDLYDRFEYKMDDCSIRTFDGAFKIADIYIEAFRVYHKDGKISGAFGFALSNIVNDRKYKIGYVTDTGKICPLIINKLINSNILIIESNYDLEMLKRSFRPQENKDWVSSDFGHLANTDCVQAIINIKKLSKAEDSLKYVFLSHISFHHNTQSLALETAGKKLKEYNINDINLFAASRKMRSQIIRID